MVNTIAAEKKIKFFTPGTIVLSLLALTGIGLVLVRFIFGIGAVTNLNDQYPWGLWIAIDVATGVALAAGGFTTAFIAHVLHKHEYHSVVRPALLTAMLGYTFVAFGVVVDLGRYYNIWHVLMPSMWQGNSALFEVGICVISYLTVLYIEFLPIVCERFIDRVNLPGFWARLNRPLDKLLRILDLTLNKVISVFIILGVVLSCMHQSSLGTVMALVSTKLHPLWHSPILPLLFLLSAFAVGFPMVIFESLLAARSYGLEPERAVLRKLSKYVPILLLVYLTARIIDMVNRGTYTYLFDGSGLSILFWAENIFGVILPMVLFSIRRVRHSLIGLFSSATLVVLGVALNRYTVFVVAYRPPYADTAYVPAISEILVTVGLISTLVLLYRFFTLNFPVIENFGGQKND